MGIQLVAIDLDGTLLNSAKEITDTTASLLRAARSTAGVHIVLATARPPRTVLPFYDLLGLDTPMINYNGALVYDPHERGVLMHRPIPAAIAHEIAVMARREYPRLAISAEVLDRWYTDRIEVTYQTETALLRDPDVIAPLEEWIDQDITKLLLLGEPEWLAELRGMIRAALRHDVEMMQTEPYLLQVSHGTVSKVQALRMVAAELQVRREQVMAIGDNANDVGMLRWAGVGVAMANAVPEAMAAADIVTDHHDADGAAKAVMNVILRGWANGT